MIWPFVVLKRDTVAASPSAFTINGEVFYDPHPGAQLALVQKVSRRVLTGEGPSKFFLRGNRGGGKSLTVRRGVLHALAMALPGLKYVAVRRNMPDLRSNHLIYLGAEMRKLGGSYHETFGQAQYDNGSLGFYRQCENFADVEKIVGAEGAILFVDEAPQIAWDNLTLMLPSLRVAKGSDGTQPYYVAAIFSGNPTGESIDDLDRHFLDKDVDDPLYDPADWEHIPVFLKDNPSVDPDEYLKQLGPIPLPFRAAWIDGVRMESRTLFEVHKTIDEGVRTKLGGRTREVPLPETMLGRPYHYIQELPEVGGVKLLKVPWIQVYRAFDLGFYPDPAACLWIVVLGRRIIVVHEGTWFRMIVQDLAAKVREETKEITGVETAANTYVDPKMAEQRNDIVTMRDVMEMNGVPCEPSINDRILYADAIHGLLGEEIEPGVPRLQIYEPGCPMLAKYLPKMRWDETNPRKMADHKFDHWPICLAYFAISSGVLSVTKQEHTQTEPVWMSWIREGQQRAGRRAR